MLSKLFIACIEVILLTIDVKYAVVGAVFFGSYLVLVSSWAVRRWPALSHIPGAKAPAPPHHPPVDAPPEQSQRVGILNEDGGESYTEDSTFGETLDKGIHNRRGGKSHDKGSTFK